MMWVKTLPCSMTMIDAEHCSGVIEADHADRDHGLQRKGADQKCIPMCTFHHRCRTDWSGIFKSWKRDDMREFLELRIELTQRLARARSIPFPEDGESSS